MLQKHVCDRYRAQCSSCVTRIATRAPFRSEARVARSAAQRHTRRKTPRRGAGGPPEAIICFTCVTMRPKNASNLRFAGSFYRFRDPKQIPYQLQVVWSKYDGYSCRGYDSAGTIAVRHPLQWSSFYISSSTSVIQDRYLRIFHAPVSQMTHNYDYHTSSEKEP